MRKKVSLLLPLMLLPLGIAHAANDQGDAAAQKSTKQEIMIVTASRDDSSLKNYAGNIALIGSQSLDMVSHTHINEIMQRSPGTWISRGNGQEHLTAIRSPVFTGAGSCGDFLMSEDGIALRAMGFCNANQLFSANSEQAEKIEIIRGPGTAVYGSDAMHGIINVISKSAPEQQQAGLTLEGGPHGYGRTKMSYGNRFAEHGFIVNYNATSDDGYKDDSGFEQQKINLRHDFSRQQIEVSSIISATDLDQDTAGYITGKDAYKDDNQKKVNNDPDAFRDATSLHLQSRISYQASEDSRLVVTPYLRDNDMEFMMHWLPGDPVEENGHSSIGLQSAFYHDASNDFRWTTGFDLEITDAYLKETQAEPGFRDIFPAGNHYDYDVDANIAATFAQLYWSSTSGTEVTAGLRFEHTAFDYSNNLSNGSACDGSVAADECRYSRPADSKESFATWSPNLGLINHLSEQLSVFANISQNYRAPQANELFRLQNGNMSTDLDPVKLNAFELGTRHTVNALYYELTVYAMKKENVIFQDIARRNINDGETDHKGIELELSYQLPHDFDIATYFTYAKHTYANNIDLLAADPDAGYKLKGNDIDTAPRHYGSAQLGWDYSSASRVELEWVHMARYYTDPDNLHRYEGHDIFNLRFSQQISKNFSAALRVTNLTDEDYAERADYTSFQGDRYFVGEPRSVYLSLKAEI